MTLYAQANIENVANGQACNKKFLEMCTIQGAVIDPSNLFVQNTIFGRNFCLFTSVMITA